MLRGVVQLLDVRHDPTDDDRAMLDFLAEVGVPVIVAATKVDKLRSSEVQPRLQALAREVGVEAGQVILFSSTTGTGRDELAEALVALLSQPSWKEA